MIRAIFLPGKLVNFIPNRVSGDHIPFVNYLCYFCKYILAYFIDDRALSARYGRYSPWPNHMQIYKLRKSYMIGSHIGGALICNITLINVGIQSINSYTRPITGIYYVELMQDKNTMLR